MPIREAAPSDAEEIIAYIQKIDAEPEGMLPRAPGEFQVTVEQERAILADHAAADNSIYLVAELDGELVGLLSCEGGTRRANRHNASFGMSVAEQHRGQGIGAALLAHLVAWATASEVVCRLELEVFEHNAGAISLYRKFDFVEEGRHKRAYFKNGKWIDGLWMARLF